MKFLGYKRADGSVGIRNHVLVVATVACSGEVARKIADSVEGAVSFVNQNGCADNEVNLKRTQDVLTGLCANPNVYGVVAVGLGCEPNTVHVLKDLVMARSPKPFKSVVIQEDGGTINAVAKGTRMAMDLVIEASKCQREECDISSFMLGTKCGGSDATSGLVSNPVMGLVSDRLIENGGTSIVTETLEMVGAEHILAKKACCPEVAEKILNYVQSREQEQTDAGGDFRSSQPSPGNKAGGITTIEEKSLGCVHKGGHTPVIDMIDYAQPPTKKGLILMDSPCYDMLAVTALVAAGCQAVVFTTGRGNAVGNPVAPVIKVTANKDTYESMQDNHDIDMSSVLEGTCSLPEMAESVLSDIIDHLNGKLVKAEALKIGYSEIVMSRQCDYI